MPFAAITFLLACFASMGFPGFSGFIAEVSILMGSWKAFPVITALAGTGILVGAGFTLRALQKSFYPAATPMAVAECEYAQITVQEKAGAILHLTATVLIGVFPRLLFNLIQPAMEQDFFKRIISG
jgi:NADH-quinone oxidoreductase subunit M